jgi:hypothetical protein
MIRWSDKCDPFRMLIRGSFKKGAATDISTFFVTTVGAGVSLGYVSKVKA